jgi:hypothetical protein
MVPGRGVSSSRSGVVVIAALDVTTIQTSGGWDMWVAASSVKAEVATVDEVAVRGADVGVD